MFFQFFAGTSDVCDQQEIFFSKLSNSTKFEESTSEVRRVAYQIIAPLTVAMGIFGNVLNLLVITTKPFIKGSTRVYLTALAISDVTVMITTIPMVVRWNYSQSKSFEAAFYYAHIELFLNNTFIASSVFIVVCLTVERYFSVCLPTKFRNVHSIRVAKFAILGCYGTAILVSAPLTALKNVCRLNFTGRRDCVEWDFHENEAITDTIYWKIYLFISEGLVRFGPCVVLSVLNVLIIRKFRIITNKRKILREALIRTRNRDVFDQESKAKYKKALRSKKYHEEKRLIALLHAIVVLFFITMTPSAILSLVYSESQEAWFGFQVFRAAANNLELANFAMNFYVYFFCSKEFRSALGQFITSCTVCEEETSGDVEMADVDTDKINNMLKVIKMDDISDFNSTGERFSVDYSAKSVTGVND
ncbi:probable G-protein coupled receptor B0563.6 isoform X1 [Atheta coriaria]|uniref:probable G-protein coupled receptor B0563.6 isoform X1 n=1 Tax=Dalotia coriaria TaxID=877792 RepID=UPI0031F34E06